MKLKRRKEVSNEEDSVCRRPLHGRKPKADHIRLAGGVGWKNPGYHYVVAPDGKITQLLDEDKVSNGVKGFNSVTVNVAYIGGIDANGKATDNRTDAQKKSLRQLLGMLKKKCPEAVIQGHRDFSPDVNGNGKVDPWERIKECPCLDEYKDLQP